MSMAQQQRRSHCAAAQCGRNVVFESQEQRGPKIRFSPRSMSCVRSVTLSQFECLMTIYARCIINQFATDYILTFLSNVTAITCFLFKNSLHFFRFRRPRVTR
jgi:hypothetical protein